MMANESKINWLPKGENISTEKYKELRSYAQEKGVVLSGFKKSDVDVELAKEFIDDASNILKEYPEINKNNKKPFTLKLNYFMDNNTFAQVPDGINHIIELNGNALRNKLKLANEYSKLANENFFVKGTDYHSIISHEIGHILSDHKKINGMDTLKNILELDTNAETLIWCRKNLSRYSSLDIKGNEILSEAFSSYRANIHNDVILKLLTKCGFIN